MYELIFDPEAIKILEKCGKDLAKRIWNKIVSTKNNPHNFFKRLTGRKEYKLRIGDYRVIADINERKKEDRSNFNRTQKKHLQEPLRPQRINFA